jgi:hypothetical protein
MTTQRFRFRAGDTIHLSASGLAIFDREERADGQQRRLRSRLIDERWERT